MWVGDNMRHLGDMYEVVCTTRVGKKHHVLQSNGFPMSTILHNIEVIFVEKDNFEQKMLTACSICKHQCGRM